MGRQLAIKQAGAFKRAKTLHIKQAGTFVRARNAFVKQAGTWKPFLTPINEWANIANLWEVTTLSAFANELTISTFVPDAVSPRIRNLNLLSNEVTVSNAPEIAGLINNFPSGYIGSGVHAGTFSENTVAFVHNFVDIGTTGRVSSVLYDAATDNIAALPDIVVDGDQIGINFIGWVSRPDWDSAYLITNLYKTSTSTFRLQITKYVKSSGVTTLAYATSFGINDPRVNTQRWIAGADGNVYGSYGTGEIVRLNTTTGILTVAHTIAGHNSSYGFLLPVWLGNEAELSYMRMPYKDNILDPWPFTAEFKQYNTGLGVWEDRIPFNFGFDPGVHSPAYRLKAIQSPYSALLAMNDIVGPQAYDSDRSTLRLFYGD